MERKLRTMYINFNFARVYVHVFMCHVFTKNLLPHKPWVPNIACMDFTDIRRQVTFLVFSKMATAVTWLKYCRYGVKLYPINQSKITLPNRIEKYANILQKNDTVIYMQNQLYKKKYIPMNDYKYMYMQVSSVILNTDIEGKVLNVLCCVVP